MIILDNLPPHKSAAVRELVEATGAKLMRLPPYSPGFNPIENVFAKLKALLRKAAACMKEALWRTIGEWLSEFWPEEWANYFRAAEYEPEQAEMALATLSLQERGHCVIEIDRLLRHPFSKRIR